jgi:hypothetical protein
MRLCCRECLWRSVRGPDRNPSPQALLLPVRVRPGGFVLSVRTVIGSSIGPRLRLQLRAFAGHHSVSAPTPTEAPPLASIVPRALSCLQIETSTPKPVWAGVAPVRMPRLARLPSQLLRGSLGCVSSRQRRRTDAGVPRRCCRLNRSRRPASRPAPGLGRDSPRLDKEEAGQDLVPWIVRA